jgi:hypothetical protein
VSHFDTVGLDQKAVDNDCESGDRRENEKKFRHHLWTPRWLARSVQRQLQSDCNLSVGRNKPQQFLAAWQESQFKILRAAACRSHQVLRSRIGYRIGNRCRPTSTSRSPDPEGRESAIPFPRWLSAPINPSRWPHRHRLAPPVPFVVSRENAQGRRPPSLL